MRNHAPYLVEGKGGLSLLLDEDETKLMNIWGRPNRRSYANPERLYYQTQTFLGSYELYHGRIISIRYNMRKNLPESLQWQTALGLRQADVEKLSANAAIDKIAAFYKNSQYIRFVNHIVVYSRGIGFHFHKGRLKYVEVFKPTRNYGRMKG